MTTATTTLADWLLQRIADEEAVARATYEQSGDALLRGRPTHTDLDSDLEWVGVGYAEHPALAIDHTRVLADCAARRAIVEMCERNVRDVSQGWIDNILRHLAAPYASHESFDPAWTVS